VDISSLFDLASVSKPFVATLAARLRQEAKLDLAAPLESLIPETRLTPVGTATLEQLMSHRAGLLAHRELFAPSRQGAPFSRDVALDQAARSQRLDLRAPFPPTYSDLGYLLLGEALVRATGMALDEAIEHYVCSPVGVSVRSARDWARVAPHRLAAAAPTEWVEYRGGLLRGVVHDDNAWAWAGRGAAGHAGLFGDAESVLRFGTALLDALQGHCPAWLERHWAEL
jgi:CubicO group peptidase (beta-lactamase class C family)